MPVTVPQAMAPCSAAASVPAPAEIGDVDVYVWDLDRATADASALTAEERQRAAAFVRERDRRRFVACRRLLRATLGRALAIPAEEVLIRVGEYGKPELGGPHADAWSFNVSHSGGVALCAVARGRAVGVDLERLRPLRDLAGLARAVLTTGERAAIFRVPPDEQVPAFLRIWTRKEAVLKAEGCGLGRQPGSLEVGADGHGRVTVASPDGPGPVRRFEVIDLRPAPGYVGALAVEADG